MSIRRVTGLLLIGAAALILEPSAAWAQSAGGPPGSRERFARLIGLRQSQVRSAAAPSRMGLAGVPWGEQAFLRRLAQQGRIPPPIPPALLVRPRPAALERFVNYRQNFTLEIYRQRGLRRGGFAGGVYFTPPAGTRFYPVSPFNIFRYFPVFRAA